MTNEIERIGRLLEKTFNKQPWYGASIMEILKDITAEVADRRIGSAHSIGELVVHMIAWRTFTTKKLSGDDDFQITDELNFPKPIAWHEALSKLEESQNELLKAVKNFPENKLGELVPGKIHKYTYYTLIHGIIQHDIYHLGQIALLKKTFTS